MSKIHTIPHIYDPELPYGAKCEIMNDLCQSLAKYKGMTEAELRLYLLKKLSVDIEKLESNPVGLLLLYEYLYSQRPEACLRSEKDPRH